MTKPKIFASCNRLTDTTGLLLANEVASNLRGRNSQMIFTPATTVGGTISREL